MLIEVIKLQEQDLPALEKFCIECGELGYNNNSSISAMKFNGMYDLGEYATFFAVRVNGEIAALSGSHSLSPTKLRCCFRGCALPRFNGIIKGLSKTFMTNLTWGPLVPEEIIDGLERGYEEFFVTTSHTSHDPSGKMHRTHKAMQLLAKQGIVDYAGIEVFYHIPQTLWKFNLPRLFETLRAFEPTRQELNILPHRYSLDNPLIKQYL